MIAWVAAAVAAPAVGTLVLDASPEAEVVVFPRTTPTLVEVAVYGNRVPLDGQLEGRTTRFLRQAWARSTGGGAWFVTLQLDRDDVRLDVARREGRLVWTLSQGQPPAPPTEPPPAPAWYELLTTPPARRPAAPPPMLLQPLLGDASTLRPAPVDALSLAPSGWPEGGNYKPSPSAIDAYRAVWTDPGADADAHAGAWVRGALTYAALGQPREAIFYLDRALAFGADDPALPLQAARAEWRLSRADAAAKRCRQAADLGAAPLELLGCLAAEALGDRRRSPSDVGRALGALADDPTHRWLAGHLLLADHRAEEALGLLEPLAEGQDPRVFAAIGDARWMRGEVDAAVEAWRVAATDRGLRGPVSLRIEMAELAMAGPERFPSVIPRWLAIADAGGPRSADARYLLAQIGEVHVDPDLVATQLMALWRDDPERALRADVPERLLATCQARLAELAERPAAQVAFFGDCWHPDLDAMITDPQPLEAVAASLSRLGLREDALAVQQRAMAVLVRRGEDARPSLVRLASLLVEEGRPQEALDTLAYAQKNTPEDRELGPTLRHVEGLARWALGEQEAALALWSRPDATPASRAERGRALARLGRCEEALRALAEDPLSRLDRARCLLTLGRPDAVPAALDHEALREAPYADDAAWLLSVAVTMGASGEAAGVWAAVRDAVRDDAAWHDAFRARRDR